MPRLRRLLTVFGLASILAVGGTGCIVVRDRGCHSPFRALRHCADFCVRVCR